jgi:predicted ATPase/DNA-binding XRE family transcriptional regulator
MWVHDEGRTHEVTGGQDAPFGARLRQVRESAGLTQEDLAARAGLSAKGISDLERGARRRPHPHTVRSLADALELSEDERASLLAAVPKRSDVAHAGPPVTQAVLPTPLVPLVGREQDLEEVTGFLRQGEMRLITLTGAGGVGKTRLALEAARHVGKFFPDGIAFIALAPLNDAGLVISTVAYSMGLRETPGQTPHEALREHLRDKWMLLLLDNFEHLLPAAPAIADMMASCPNLTVLVTSRAPLLVRGEQEYSVPPLELPSSTLSPAPEEVVSSPSGRLFVERVRAASPAFELTRENAGAVAAICWRLAGLPLALELAAVRVRFLDPAALLSRLDQALSVGWARDLPERQRTMNATLGWSHDLLSEPERVLFRRLSVFSGGFSLDAAEAINANDVDVFNRLGRLVEQSLVTVEPNETKTRYGMLEPVRQYAQQMLEESGESRSAERSHASFFLTLAEKAHPKLMGEGQVEWLERLDQDYGNLRAALSRALDAGDAETGARMGWALWHFWWIRGHHREGRQWMEAVLERDLPPALRARALVAAGTLAFSHGDYEQCERYSQKGLELSRHVGDELQAAWARVGLGVVAMSRADHEAAAPHLEEALRSFRELDEHFGVARMTICLGMVALMRGEEDEAIPMFEEGLAVARQIGDMTSAYITLYSLAQVALSRGDHDQAAALFEEGITASEQVGDRANVAYCLEGLGMIAGRRYQAERCACLIGAAEELLEAVGSPIYNYYKPDPSLYERTLSATRSRLGEVAFDEARERGRGMTFAQALEYALEREEASPL